MFWIIFLFAMLQIIPKTVADENSAVAGGFFNKSAYGWQGKSQI